MRPAAASVWSSEATGSTIATATNGSRCPFQTAIECDGPFAGIATGFQADFHKDCKTVSLLKGEPGGNGRLLFPLHGKRKMAEGDVSQDYIVDTVK